MWKHLNINSAGGTLSTKCAHLAAHVRSRKRLCCVFPRPISETHRTFLVKPMCAHSWADAPCVRQRWVIGRKNVSKTNKVCAVRAVNHPSGSWRKIISTIMRVEKRNATWGNQLLRNIWDRSKLCRGICSSPTSSSSSSGVVNSAQCLFHRWRREN